MVNTINQFEHSLFFTSPMLGSVQTVVPIPTSTDDVLDEDFQAYLQRQIGKISGPQQIELMRHIRDMKHEMANTINALERDQTTPTVIRERVKHLQLKFKHSIDQFINGTKEWQTAKNVERQELHQMDVLLQGAHVTKRQRKSPVLDISTSSSSHTASVARHHNLGLGDGFTGLTLEENIQSGMMLVNVLSMPGRAVNEARKRSGTADKVCSVIGDGVDLVSSLPAQAIEGGIKGVKWLCNTSESTQKVCRPVKTSLQDAAALVVEKSQKFLSKFSVESPVPQMSLPEVFERKYGIPQSQTAYFMESCGIVKRTFEVGLTVGGVSAIGKSAISSVGSLGMALKTPMQRMSIQFQKSSSMSISQGNGTITHAVQKFIPSSYGVKEWNFKSFNASASFEHVLTKDNTMRVYVEVLRAGGASKAGSTKTHSIFFNAIQEVKGFALKNGAKRIHLQFLPSNDRLHKLISKRFKHFKSLGQQYKYDPAAETLYKGLSHLKCPVFEIDLLKGLNH